MTAMNNDLGKRWSCQHEALGTFEREQKERQVHVQHAAVIMHGTVNATTWESQTPANSGKALNVSCLLALMAAMWLLTITVVNVLQLQ